MDGLPELSELVGEKLVEGDHPEGLVDGDADVESGPLHDLLKDLATSFGCEEVKTTEGMDLE